MLRTIGPFTAILLLWTPAARAQEDRPDFARPGWYLGLGASLGQVVGGDDITSLAVEREINRTLPTPSSSTRTEMLTGISVGDSTGFNARVGYRFFRYLAAEIQADYLPSFSTQGNYSRNTLLCDGNRFEACTPHDRQRWLFTPEKPDGPPAKWTLKSDYDGKDGLKNGTRGVTGEVQRQTNLLIMTVNGKVPLLTGRFQPFVLAGLGLYYASSKNETAQSGTVITGERLALAPGQPESVRTGYAHTSLSSSTVAIDGEAPYDTDPNTPPIGANSLSYLQITTSPSPGEGVVPPPPYGAPLDPSLIIDGGGVRNPQPPGGYPDDLEFHQTANPSISEMGLPNSETGFAMRFGGGVDLYFTENFLLSFDASWVYTPGFSSLPIDDPGFLSIGLGAQYRF